jgi:hypothetical protein
MSYLTQGEIAANQSMTTRVAQCAAQQQVNVDPDRWTADYRRTWAAAPGWDEAWESSQASHPDDPNYDPGADEAVITDAQILSQVQSMLTSVEPASS